MGRAVDYVVVGSGAGGGVAAMVLAQSGREVVLLERGRNPFLGLDRREGIERVLLSNDELKGLRNFLNQDPITDPRTFRTSERDGDRSFVGAVQPLPFAVGGGTLTYDADSPRPLPEDFRFLSAWGAVPDAEVVDWPLGYDDLEPYLCECEWLLGVQGDGGQNPFEPRRSARYPMPPGYIKYDALLLAAGAKEMGLHPYPTPQAINSMAYRGRPSCANCGFCPYGCPINAKGSTAVTAIRDALLTGRCELRAECLVTRLVTDSTGRKVTGVEYLDPAGELRVQEAVGVLLGCNPIETVRLLQLSASAAHPAGLGNSSGWLGQCLMFHINFMAVGVFDHRLHGHRGRPVTMEVGDFRANVDGDPNYLFGGVVELGARLDPIQEALNYTWGPLHKTMMRESWFRDRFTATAMVGEDMPVRSNRIDFDPRVRDAWGRPAPRITYQNHPRDLAVQAYFLPKLEEMMRRAGAQITFGVNIDVRSGGIPSTNHILGGARMGSDPSFSVTDGFGRFHDLDNLWCVDGSTWPTSMGVNPTLTFQALAYRTAASIVEPSEPERVLAAIGISPVAEASRARGTEAR